MKPLLAFFVSVVFSTKELSGNLQGLTRFYYRKTTQTHPGRHPNVFQFALTLAIQITQTLWSYWRLENCRWVSLKEKYASEFTDYYQQKKLVPYFFNRRNFKAFHARAWLLARWTRKSWNQHGRLFLLTLDEINFVNQWENPLAPNC